MADIHMLPEVLQALMQEIVTNHPAIFAEVQQGISPNQFRLLMNNKLKTTFGPEDTMEDACGLWIKLLKKQSTLIIPGSKDFSIRRGSDTPH